MRLRDHNDLNAFYPLNLQFHHAITEYGGNERLMVLAASIQREAHLFRRLTLDMTWPHAGIERGTSADCRSAKGPRCCFGRR